MEEMGFKENESIKRIIQVVMIIIVVVMVVVVMVTDRRILPSMVVLLLMSTFGFKETIERVLSLMLGL